MQLAGLELERNRARRCSSGDRQDSFRWKEAATGDVLDAQLALKRGRTGEAIEHFDFGLEEGP